MNLTGYKGDKLNYKVTITSVEGELLEITDVTSDVADKIAYELKTVEKGKEYTLEVKNK